MADTSDLENLPGRPFPSAGTRQGNADNKADYIADSLKALYKATEQEPLPERFSELLHRLAQEDGS